MRLKFLEDIHWTRINMKLKKIKNNKKQSSEIKILKILEILNFEIAVFVEKGTPSRFLVSHLHVF